METVGLVGAAERFETLLEILRATHTQPLLWAQTARDVPQGVELVEGPELATLPLIFVDVPIAEARVLMRKLGDVITGRQVLLHLGRELEPETHKTLSEIILEETPARRVGFLTGPMHPRGDGGELAAAVCATRFPEVHGLCEEAMLSDRCRLYRTMDLTGAELSAAYSRVLSVVIGVARGMGRGQNITSVLFTRGLAEASQVVARCGGAERTAFGMSGTGNLFAEVTAPGSPEYQLGVRLAQEGIEGVDARMAQTVESLRTLVASLVAIGHASGITGAVLLNAAQALLSGGITPAQAAEAMMSLPVFDE